MLKKNLACLVAAFLVTGCAQLPQQGASAPVQQRYTLNGLVMTPVPQFPASAWRGMPAVRTVQDLQTTKQLTYIFARAARRAADQGNMEVAMLNWYATQQLAGQGLSILGSSLSLIQSIDRYGDGRLPAHGLALLPTQNMETSAMRLSALEDELLKIMEPPVVSLANGVMVAGGDDDVLREITAAKSPQQQRSSTQGADAQRGGVIDTLPLNTPVAIQGGLYVERRADVFVIYNNTDQPTTVPLSRIGYVPPLEPPTQARMAAAPFVRQISNSFWNYADFVAQKRIPFHCEVARPNRMSCVGVESPNFDADGFLIADSRSGSDAYARNPAYRNAIDMIIAASKIQAREEFRTTCVDRLNNYFNEKIVGPNAEIKKMSCAPRGRSANGATTTDLYMGENGTVKTYGTLMNEKATRNRMTKEALTAAAWSDAVSYVPLVGSLEDAAKCIGMDNSVVTTIYHQINNPALSDTAVLAGWKPTPPADASIATTAANCIGAIPLAATAGKIVKGGAGLFKNQKALIAAAGRTDELFGLFRNSLSPAEFEKSYAAITRAYPNNKELAIYVKAMSDLLQHSDDMSSTIGGVSKLSKEYLPQYFGG